MRSVSERVALSDAVASAKWTTGKPIDDPERERRVLDDAGRRAIGFGLAPEEVKRWDELHAAVAADPNWQKLFVRGFQR